MKRCREHSLCHPTFRREFWSGKGSMNIAKVVTFCFATFNNTYRHMYTTDCIVCSTSINFETKSMHFFLLKWNFNVKTRGTGELKPIYTKLIQAQPQNTLLPQDKIVLCQMTSYKETTIPPNQQSEQLKSQPKNNCAHPLPKKNILMKWHNPH